MATALSTKVDKGAARAVKQTARPYRSVPNLNLFPEELKRKQLTAVGRNSLYLLAVSAVVLVVLFNRQQSLQTDNASLYAELETARSRISIQKELKAEADKLAVVKEKLERASIDYASLAGFAGWSSFLQQTKDKAAASGVVLTSVKQKAGGATLIGSSPSPSEAVNFYRALGSLQGVSSASIVSLSKAASESKFAYTVDVTFVNGGKSETRP